VKNRGQAYSLVLGQCTQLLQDQIKQDNEWTNVSTSNNLLRLYRLIEKVVQGQTDETYSYAAICDQLIGLLGYRQEGMTNAQWYERFNMRVDVAESIGVSFEFKGLLDHQTKEDHTPHMTFESLDEFEKESIRTKVRETFLTYVMLRNSGKQHGALRQDLQNTFTTGDNRYPDTRQKALHLLDHYSKKPTVTSTQSEGSTFAQRGNNKRKKTYNQAKGKYDAQYRKIRSATSVMSTDTHRMCVPKTLKMERAKQRVTTTARRHQASRSWPRV